MSISNENDNNNNNGLIIIFFAATINSYLHLKYDSEYYIIEYETPYIL